MDFGFNQEQELLRNTARKFLENECNSEFVRARMAEPAGVTDAFWNGYWQYHQLRSRGNTIEAGTSEVLRNIIAERVLGLPRSR